MLVAAPPAGPTTFQGLKKPELLYLGKKYNKGSCRGEPIPVRHPRQVPGQTSSLIDSHRGGVTGLGGSFSLSFLPSFLRAAPRDASLCPADSQGATPGGGGERPRTLTSYLMKNKHAGCVSRPAPGRRIRPHGPWHAGAPVPRRSHARTRSWGQRGHLFRKRK